MTATLTADGPIAFGEFVLDPHDERVLGPDGPVRLGNKAYNVLGALIAQRGRLLTKEVLFETVWDGTIVSESALTSVIKELRRALGDESKSPRYIESVYGRGYRFLPEVVPASLPERMPGAAQSARPPLNAVASSPPRRSSRLLSTWRIIAGGISGVAGLIAIVTWLGLRPLSSQAHPATVRFPGFTLVGAGLPADFAESARNEAMSAFSNEGQVGVSTAGAAPPGTAPAYLLTGAIRRDGDSIRISARVENERNHAVLWSRTFDYPAAEAAAIPRRMALATGTLVRCALSGAATHPAPLSDAALTAYFGNCSARYLDRDSARGLDFARRTVALAPDFSMGWSAVAEFAGRAIARAPTPAMKAALRKEAEGAAARALRLDPRNPEALDVQASLIDRRDLVAKEAKLRESVAARPLDCGCQHQHYGMLLSEVGRSEEAIAHYRRVSDLMPIDPSGAIALSEMYARVGNVEDYARQMKRVHDHNPEWPNLRTYNQIVINTALFTRNYAPAIAALRGDENRIPATRRAAYLAAFEALASGDAAAKSRAVPAILAEANNPRLIDQLTVSLLGALGASREALAASAALGTVAPGAARDTLMMPTMAEARKLPEFVALAEKLGLMRYWRETKKKPDFCTARDAPAMCARI